MAIFDLRAVIDPLAKEFRDGYETLLAHLNVIGGHLSHLVAIGKEQHAATEETNRLLRGLVELQATPSAGKLTVQKRILGGDS